MLLLSPVNKIYWRLLRGLRQQWDAHLTRYFVGSFVEAQCLSYGVADGSDGAELGDDGRLADQRIARDVGVFVQLSTSLSLEAMQAAIHLYFYTGVLREVSASLSGAAAALAVLGTGWTRCLGRALPGLYAAERHADGEFTYTLTRARENAESIAFY